jgi:hypothetical protein
MEENKKFDRRQDIQAQFRQLQRLMAINNLLERNHKQTIKNEEKEREEEKKKGVVA